MAQLPEDGLVVPNGLAITPSRLYDLSDPGRAQNARAFSNLAAHQDGHEIWRPFGGDAPCIRWQIAGSGRGRAHAVAQTIASLPPASAPPRATCCPSADPCHVRRQNLHPPFRLRASPHVALPCYHSIRRGRIRELPRRHRRQWPRWTCSMAHRPLNEHGVTESNAAAENFRPPASAGGRPPVTVAARQLQWPPASYSGRRGDSRPPGPAGRPPRRR
jgi:hypothetical protein